MIIRRIQDQSKQYHVHTLYWWLKSFLHLSLLCLWYHTVTFIFPGVSNFKDPACFFCSRLIVLGHVSIQCYCLAIQIRGLLYLEITSHLTRNSAIIKYKVLSQAVFFLACDSIKKILLSITVCIFKVLKQLTLCLTMFTNSEFSELVVCYNFF